MSQAGLVPWAPVTDRRRREADAMGDAARLAADAPAGPGGFAEHFDQVPALLVLLADLSPGRRRPRPRPLHPRGRGFDLSVCLEHPAGRPCRRPGRGPDHHGGASRGPASGTCSGCRPSWAVAGALALGYPAGRRPHPAAPDAVDEFARVDRFDGSLRFISAPRGPAIRRGRARAPGRRRPALAHTVHHVGEGDVGVHVDADDRPAPPAPEAGPVVGADRHLGDGSP